MSLKDLIPSWLKGGTASDPWPNGANASRDSWPSPGKPANPRPSSVGKTPTTHSVSNISVTNAQRAGGNAPCDLSGDTFADFHREVDRMRDEFFKDNDFARGLMQNPGAASGLKVEETPSEYRVTVELPGADEKSVNIQARDNMLSVSCEQHTQHNEGDGNRQVTEQFYNRFERMVPFQTAIDPDKVASTFKSGVLYVTLPKRRN
jgi:HSP20 family protein